MPKFELSPADSMSEECKFHPFSKVNYPVIIIIIFFSVTLEEYDEFDVMSTEEEEMELQDSRGNNHRSSLKRSIDEVLSLVFNDKQQKQQQSQSSKDGHGVIRRTGYYRKYVAVPRVLKRDIRRQFPEMIINILNASDFTLFHSFFETFSTGNHDIRFRVKDSVGVGGFETTDQLSHLFHRELPERLAYKGYAWIFYHWYLMSTLNPDQVVHLDDARIHTQSGSMKSRVALDVSVDFHRLYDIHLIRFLGSLFGAMVVQCGRPLPLGSSNEQEPQFRDPPPVQEDFFSALRNPLNNPALNVGDNETDAAAKAVFVRSFTEKTGPLPQLYPSSTTPLGEITEPTIAYAYEELYPPDPFDYYARKAGKHMPLLPSPQRAILRMRFTFHLNEFKRIEMLETSNLRVH